MATDQLVEKVDERGEAPLSYLQGAANGPPLVFVHGYTMAGQTWNRVVGAFVDSATVYGLDARVRLGNREFPRRSVTAS